jgi:hypothetical protein
MQRILRNIERLGDIYCEKHLTWDKDELERNWWKALTFFFNHSFYRGRRDKLSNEYCHFAIEALKRFFHINSRNLEESYKSLKRNVDLFDKNIILGFKESKNMRNRNSIRHQDFELEVASKNRLIKQLITAEDITIEWYGITYQKKVYLGNDEDIMMVLDVLNFISSKNRKNVYQYLKQLISDFGPRKAYNELTKLRAVSDKIATLIIRDVALMNPDLIESDYEYAFPVDTWVQKIYKKLTHNTTSRIRDKEIKRFFITNCKSLRINPLKFAAGLWYLGFNSLDIVLKFLEEFEIQNVQIDTAENRRPTRESVLSRVVAKK